MARIQPLVPAGAPMPRQAYPSDLTDAQWRVLEPLLQYRESSGPSRPADGRVAGCSERTVVHQTDRRFTSQDSDQ